MIRVILFVVVFFSNSSLYAEWTPFMSINDNYWSKYDSSQNIVLVLESNFHSCGWNAAADIRESEVGSDLYKTLTSVALSSIMANKKISVWIADSGLGRCIDDRAKVTGIRIQK